MLVNTKTMLNIFFIENPPTRALFRKAVILSNFRLKNFLLMVKAFLSRLRYVVLVFFST